MALFPRVLGRGLAVWAILASLHAYADDAESLVHKGIELRKAGKEREALELFQRAAEIKKTPRVLAQLGLAEQALGLWVKAEQHLKEALESGRDAWIQKNRRALDDSWRVLEDHLGSLEVWGEPAGAEILIDGEPVGKLPADTIRLPIGDVTVTVRAPGYGDVTRQVQIPKADMVREHVELHALPVRPVAVRPVAASDGAPAAETPNLIERGPGPTPSAEEGSSPIYKRWWFWTAVGAVVVGAGATTFLLVRRSGSTAACDPGVMCGTWGAGN
jgi:hypothetical protein